MIIHQERTEQTVGEAVMNIFDIRIQINDDIAMGDIKRFPEVFAFAFKLFQVWQNFGGIIYIGAV